MILKIKAIAGVTTKAISALWTFPSLIISAFIIAWAAEAAQFIVSQGLALAILAWLQTLPEFAVEAAIAWEAGVDPEKVHLITANFTGSLRLLVGLGWPLIYFVSVFFNKRFPFHRRFLPIKFDREHSVEVVALFPPILYFVIILLKGTLSLFDSAILFLLYLAYLFILNRIPPHQTEELKDAPYLTRKVMSLPHKYRKPAVFGLFLLGGVILFFIAEPFLHSMLALATAMGISHYIFVQWLAPFLSEFPEKVSALNWARTVKKAPIGVMNMVSSNINQWTVLVGMIPIVYSLSRGGISVVEFDHHQKVEILLTMVQSSLGMILLANMKFNWYEALGIFALWFIQFIYPHLREEIIILYSAWIIFELILALSRKKRLYAFGEFRRLLKEHF
jgi:cation:H+ antiporter